MTFFNVYDDAHRAEAYGRLEFPATYYLAFRDLPAIIAEHITGYAALDFGCGTGRSTRFLRRLGFEVAGIDISGSMVQQAKRTDPHGDYRLVVNGDFNALEPSSFDLVLSSFTFDNIPGIDNRRDLLQGLRGLLKDRGRIILVGSTPEIYTHEWGSFTTKDYPENRYAKSGDAVQIVMRDVPDKRPVVDLIWFHEDYLRLFAASELHMVDCYRPLGRMDEPYEWVNETSVAPWVIYVLKKKDVA